MRTRITLPLVLRIIGTLQLLAIWLWGLTAFLYASWWWTLLTLVVSTVWIMLLLAAIDREAKP